MANALAISPSIWGWVVEHLEFTEKGRAFMEQQLLDGYLVQVLRKTKTSNLKEVYWRSKNPRILLHEECGFWVIWVMFNLNHFPSFAKTWPPKDLTTRALDAPSTAAHCCSGLKHSLLSKASHNNRRWPKDMERIGGLIWCRGGGIITICNRCSPQQAVDLWQLALDGERLGDCERRTLRCLSCTIGHCLFVPKDIFWRVSTKHECVFRWKRMVFETPCHKTMNFEFHWRMLKDMFTFWFPYEEYCHQRQPLYAPLRNSWQG